MDRLCADTRFRLEMTLERGDMQFVNNYVFLHSRTSYTDHVEDARKRSMLRLATVATGSRSVSLKIPTICSSVNFDFLILRLLSEASFATNRWPENPEQVSSAEN